MTKVTHDELKDLYQRQTSRGDRAACLTAEEIAAMAGGELAAEARQRASLHLADCSTCSAEMQTALGLGPWAGDLAEKLELGSTQVDETGPGQVTDLEAARQARHATRRQAAFTNRRWIPAALAAGLATVMVSAYLLAPGSSSPPGDAIRGGGVTDARPAPNAVIGQAPHRFSWPPQLGAESYRLRLLDADAELIWESAPLQLSRTELPLAVQRRLDSPGDYLWIVVIEGAAQRRELGPFTFRVAPE